MARVFHEGARYFIAFALALAVGTFLIMGKGDNPLLVYRALLEGGIGNGPSLLQTLRWASPLILSGLANIVAFRAQIWNIGVEGQILTGALATAVVGSGMEGLPAFFHIPLALLAGAVAGALWALLPAVLYVRFRLNELVSTIMMNYIAALLTEYLVRFHLHEPYQGTSLPNWVATSEIMDSAKLPALFPPYQVNVGLFIAIGLALALSFAYRRSVPGYEADMIGLNRRFAQYGGVRTAQVMLMIFLVSGAIAGVTGATEILGAQYRFTSTFTSGLGFDGIMVALLAGNTPVGTMLAGSFVGALRNGALEVERMTDTNRAMITVIQSLVLMFFTVHIWLPPIQQWLLGSKRKAQDA